MVELEALDLGQYCFSLKSEEALSVRRTSCCFLNIPIIMYGNITMPAINSVNCNNVNRVIRQLPLATSTKLFTYMNKMKVSFGMYQKRKGQEPPYWPQSKAEPAKEQIKKSEAAP